MRLKRIGKATKGLFALAILISFYSASQELPPIERFAPQDYKGDDQNWSISQDDNQNIYVANNRGLLEYNGARWNLYTIPNQSIVRSVAVVESRIYTGSYMDFGYWERDKYGTLNYNSITKELKQELIEDEEFWNIIAYNSYIVFQSLDRIYIYDPSKKSFGIIESKTQIVKSYRTEDAVYFFEKDVGVSKIQDGKASLIIDSKSIQNHNIINIFSSGNSLLIQTRENGFYSFEGADYDKWNISTNSLLSSVSVYNSLRLRNGNFVLGTISNGVLILDSSGNLLYQINKNSGLSNNTVLSTFEDKMGNVWFGLDNGINVINLNSPYRIYQDNEGYLGTIYASEKTNDYLYLGTNQGLFYKLLDSQDRFKLVPNTKGQVWFLKKIRNQLFCGHDKGSFEISDGKAIPISNNDGVWKISKIENNSNLLIAGNYNGLSILEKDINNRWKFRNTIRGFNISSRYFEFIDNKNILVSHEYKGVYNLELSQDFYNVVDYNKIDIDKSIGSGLVKYKENILYSYRDGIFQYENESKSFKKTDIFKSYHSEDNYVSGKLVNQKADRGLIAFFKDEIAFLNPGMLADEPTIRTIYLPSSLRGSKLGFENILSLDDGRYLLGTTNGYLIIDANKYNLNEYEIAIDKVSYSKLLQDEIAVSVSEPVELKSRENNLYFKYSVPDFQKLVPSLYQYRLVGIYDSWSDWSSQSSVFYENLPYGNYTFEVRAKVGSKMSSNMATYNFSIAKPWYATGWAIVGYVFLFLIIAALIQYLNRLYYKRQKRQLLLAKEKEFEITALENDRKIMEFKNQSLQKDIENKSRELGISTMNLIRKNEFLNSLKKELNALNKGNELKKIIKIIDKNINNNEDWKFFEEAFNNADKDFLKKIKTKHPSLTPNDLKLCAYLRLNLSSKEIAPLLNISHRSVEVKRYRLRKKMDLPHEASLTNYILDI
ncbi:regulatory LuxR family protein [Winogradskyella wandonensis]|uniref:Regulatory LuxR family protein n=1 Tax=Winogradskyella wandonensis TaxID=1442586 RepID=A0A4R1KSE7_9FLAO|nr:triple tyrosine motif-containing protein [Winogradskyella wandonensis]TCK67513.1 regulatory LuxR family protein [Winogradskyella wandonensis]